MLNLFSKLLAVVGPRKADNYGISVINLLLPDIINCGWTCVSGGAYGVDTLVHKKSVDLGGKTIAVLGSGLLNLYPDSNKRLFQQIVDGGGTLLSSFSLNAPPLAGNFPARNRIIAGLSKACIVIQAAQKSGALITANFALEQGKEVGAIPGPIDNALSYGCNELIKQGAACITNSIQLLELLNDNSYLKLKPNNNIIKETRPETLDEKILSLCSNPLSFDELLSKLNISFSELNDKLLELNFNGLLFQNFLGLWESSNNR